MQASENPMSCIHFFSQIAEIIPFLPQERVSSVKFWRIYTPKSWGSGAYKIWIEAAIYGCRWQLNKTKG